MRQHPGISAEIVRPLFDEELVAGVRHHHERFDGLGYPDGLAGEDIPIDARAMCVVDCYDAMSCQRPYRQRAELWRVPGRTEALQRHAVRPGDGRGRSGARCSRLQQQTRDVLRPAQAARQSIDPAAHALLRTHADQERPEYEEMVSALRRLRDANPPVRFITTFALHGEQCVSRARHRRDRRRHLALRRPLAAPKTNSRASSPERACAPTCSTPTTTASGCRASPPCCDAHGEVVAAITVDAPAFEVPRPVAPRATVRRRWRRCSGRRPSASAARRSRRSPTASPACTTTATCTSASRRSSSAVAAAGASSPCSSATATSSRPTTTTTATRPATPPCGASRASCEANSRRTDLAARYGGEEFVLVLIDTDAAGAHVCRRGLRAEVEAVSARYGRPLTISIGVATSPDDAGARTSSSTRPTGRCTRPSAPGATACSPSRTGSCAPRRGCPGAADRAFRRGRPGRPADRRPEPANAAWEVCAPSSCTSFVYAPRASTYVPAYVPASHTRPPAGGRASAAAGGERSPARLASCAGAAPSRRAPAWRRAARRSRGPRRAALPPRALGRAPPGSAPDRRERAPPRRARRTRASERRYRRSPPRPPRTHRRPP